MYAQPQQQQQQQQQPQQQQQLQKRIGWLNTQGGFQNSIDIGKIFETMGQVNTTLVEVNRILKDLETKGRSSVKNPTAYVTSAMRKSGQTSGMNNNVNFNAFAAVPNQTINKPRTTMQGNAKTSHQQAQGLVDPSFDKLRKRISWLNTEGGFNNLIRYEKVMEAVGQVNPEYPRVLKILNDLQKNMGVVKDPTAFVTSRLRMKEMSPDDDKKLRSRIGYLNQTAGFARPIMYPKVKEAAEAGSGCDLGAMWGILKDLEEKKGAAMVGDPTAYICTALRKASAITSGLSIADKKLKMRIGWLNTHGGFANNLNYAKIAAAAGESQVGEKALLAVLKNTEQKKLTMRNPTAFVASALRRRGPAGSKPAIMKLGKFAMSKAPVQKFILKKGAGKF